MESLKDKVCIITGAGKGFGRNIALEFAKQGAKVAAISRTESDMKQLQKELSTLTDCITETGDASDSTTITSFVKDVRNHFSQIDILINNAGIRFRRPFLDITDDEWDNIMKANLFSTFKWCQCVGPSMINQRSGKIINMASIIGTLGLPELVGYGASKGGIIALSKSLALEWATHNIQVNVIAPGFCETSYADGFKKNLPDLYQFTLDRIPTKKWGSSKNISDLCLFLASDMSDYITGEVISIDGGWSAW